MTTPQLKYYYGTIDDLSLEAIDDLVAKVCQSLTSPTLLEAAATCFELNSILQKALAECPTSVIGSIGVETKSSDVKRAYFLGKLSMAHIIAASALKVRTPTPEVAKYLYDPDFRPVIFTLAAQAKTRAQMAFDTRWSAARVKDRVNQLMQDGLVGYTRNLRGDIEYFLQPDAQKAADYDEATGF